MTTVAIKSPAITGVNIVTQITTAFSGTTYPIKVRVVNLSSIKDGFPDVGGVVVPAFDVNRNDYAISKKIQLNNASDLLNLAKNIDALLTINSDTDVQYVIESIDSGSFVDSWTYEMAGYGVLNKNQFIELKNYIIANYDDSILDTLSPLAPTVTFTNTVGSYTTGISGGVRVFPKLASATHVDVVNGDPQFEMSGMGKNNTLLPLTAGDSYQSALLTGGTSQAARWAYDQRFVFSGQVFEYLWRAANTSASFAVFRFLVNRKPITAAFVNQNITSNNRYVTKVDFGSRLEGALISCENPDSCQNGGFFIEPTGTMSPPAKRPNLVIIGDSIAGGAGGSLDGTYRQDSFGNVAAKILNLNCSNIAIGGTGYTVGADSTYYHRLNDTLYADPDILVIIGGQNDRASNSAQIYAKAVEYIQAVRANMSKPVLIVVVGCYMVNALSTTDATAIVAEAALKQAASENNCIFISLMDPEQLAATATAWAASTTYLVGHTVFYGMYAWRCTVLHTSTGSFDITKWRSTSFITGTRSGATLTNDGNADIFIRENADNLHLQKKANTALGKVVAKRIRDYFINGRLA